MKIDFQYALLSGGLYYFKNHIVLLSLKVDFVLANSANRDEKSQHGSKLFAKVVSRRLLLAKQEIIQTSSHNLGYLGGGDK